MNSIFAFPPDLGVTFGPMTTTSTRVAANIRAELGRQRISTAHVRQLLGMSQSSLSRRLLGQYPLNVDELTTISEFLGVDPLVLLGRSTTDVTAA
jgi:transcriptional regulator with XRE-family HTH domain